MQHTKAKQHLQDDPTFTKKKLQFDHVWPILKNAEKWTDNGRSSKNPRQKSVSSERYDSTSQTSRSGPFAVDLNEDEDEQELHNEELHTTHRPIGIKKAKAKRYEETEKFKLTKQIKESNQELKALFEKSMLERNAFSAMYEDRASRKLAIQQEREENKIMLTSIDSITDHEGREYLRMKKAEIMEKRAHLSHPQQPPTTFGAPTPFQFPSATTTYGDHQAGMAEYGSVPRYGASGGSSSSGMQGAQQFGDSIGYGGLEEQGRNDDVFPEY